MTAAVATSGKGVHPPVIAVGAIVVEDDNLLMIRRGTPPSMGAWSVPGGRLDNGELLAEAVVRELAEETGLEGVCGSLIGIVERFDGEHHFVILDYAVTLLDTSVPPTAGGDAAAVAWVPLSEINERPLTPGLAEFLHDHGILDTLV